MRLAYSAGATASGGAAAGVPAARDGLVTRPESLTGETEAATALPFFVDWVTISQDHPEGGLPEVCSGLVWAADENGDIQWRTIKAAKHEGSFETSITVKCDGHRVTCSGNIGRFGRPDNLFGFGLEECVRRYNEILAAYGLPPFRVGARFERARRGDVEYQWSGARISRLDITANFEAGSADNAHLVMQYLGSQHNGRKNGRVLAQGETVDWGAGSRRQYWKAYVKHVEMIRHAGAEVDGRTADLIAHCRDRGIVRFEGTVRSNALTELGCAFLGDYESGWAMGQLVQLFNTHSAVLTRAERATDDLDDLPRHLRATARDYLAGTDCSRSLSRATFYRHRTALLAFGLDIAVRNVSPFTPRVRVVELVRAEVPPWYQLAA